MTFVNNWWGVILSVSTNKYIRAGRVIYVHSRFYFVNKPWTGFLARTISKIQTCTTDDSESIDFQRKIGIKYEHYNKV